MQDKQLAQIEQQIEQAIPQEKKDAYERIVAAGLKLMFSPETNSGIFKGASEGNVPSRLAMITAGVIAILAKESRGSMPMDVAMPAAMILLLHALDFIATAGAIKITPNIIGQARDALGRVLKQQLQSQEQPEQSQEQSPEQQPQEPPVQGGMINAAMMQGA